MSELGESIIKGMEEALEFAKGKKSKAVIHIPEEINVRRIRKKLKMSQNIFADYFGVPVRTIQDWEQGRRVPSGASRNFLLVIDQEPEAVHRALIPYFSFLMSIANTAENSGISSVSISKLFNCEGCGKSFSKKQNRTFHSKRCSKVKKQRKIPSFFPLIQEGSGIDLLEHHLMEA